MFMSAAVLASFATISVAQFTSLSSQCESTLTSIATGPASGCLNVGGVIPIIASSNTSLVGPINDWLGGLCGEPACDNSTLTSAVTNVTTGCQSDIASFGLPSSVVQSLPQYVTQYYPVAREAVCLRDTTANSSLCVTSTLRTIEAALGKPLTLSNIVGNIGGLLGNSTLEKTVACTQCAQGAYAIIRPSLPSGTASSTDSFFKSTCGDSFVSGGEPTNIIVATGALATPSPSSGDNAGFARASIPSSLPIIASSSVALLGGAMAFAWTTLL